LRFARQAPRRHRTRSANPVETETNALEEVLDAYHALGRVRADLVRLAEVITPEDEDAAEAASRSLLAHLDETTGGIVNAMRVLIAPRYRDRAIEARIVRVEDDPAFGDTDPLASLA
jgi:hypothetical protein